MNTSFSHLPASQEQNFRQVVSSIVEAVEPEKIICYGTRTSLEHAWSSFDPVLASKMDTDYDLLIITKPGQKRRDHEIYDKIAKLSTPETRIIAITHSLYAVNEALEQGRPFFTAIFKQGILIYDSSGIPLVTPSVCDKSDLLADIQAHWDQHFGLAGKFFDGASYYITSGSAALAVFMLHQATEHTCIALIRACLDYRATTHNLTKLLALTENFSPSPSYVFPQTTEEEIDLFKTLLNAYSDARYCENFKLPIEKAEILRQRVNELRDIAFKLYKERMQVVVGKPLKSSPIHHNNFEHERTT